MIHTSVRHGGQAPVRARVVDICDHGARVVLRSGIGVGERVDLDLECEVPLRVHLGFGVDSLVIDGPMHMHLVSVSATAVRSSLISKRRWAVGLEFNDDASFEDRQFLQHYVDHLHELESWNS